MIPGRPDINTYLPTELLREVLLYSIESNQMKSGDLASVCRYWRSVITTMPHLWSTLRVGTWTETEQVTAWVQRAYPKKVIIDTESVIDTERDHQVLSNVPFAALRNALASTAQWHELTISSFPRDFLARQLGIQGARPIHMLKILHVVAGCVHSPSFTHLLDLVPNEAPLSELRLHPAFASAYFLQPPWFPVLQNLTVLIVNGRDIHEPFGLLPAFTRLHIFEADRLLLPLYELDINLPLLCTLRRLHLRASSIQWMAGRQFPCLEECAILLPHHWEAVQQHTVRLPSCGKLTYHGYPTTAVQYFHVPKMISMDLGSHDCKARRVYQQLHHLCTVDGRVSKLTTLRLTLQCSDQAFIKVVRYLGLLQKLVLSIVSTSPSWKYFLKSLAAKPRTDDWPEWESQQDDHREWEQWCSSQTWRANVLPQLKYLGIQSPKGFSQSTRLDNYPLLRLVGWTRAQSTPPLEHLNVWEGRGTAGDMVVDYTSTGYLDKLPGMSSKEYDTMIVRGMVTQCLAIRSSAAPLFQLNSTVLFRQLQNLEINCYLDREIPILPLLEQIKRLVIWHGIIPAYSLNVDLPLVRTLRWLRLVSSTFSWMLGRTFKVLREFQIYELLDPPEIQSRHEGLQVDLPACTALELWSFSVDRLHFLSCPNVQILQWQQGSAIDEAALKSLHDFLCDFSCLQNLVILISQDLALDSLIQFVFCDVREQGVWRDIRNVEVKAWFTGFFRNDTTYRLFSQRVTSLQHYEKWWRKFTITKRDMHMLVVFRASM
jgi:hypothetical protein